MCILADSTCDLPGEVLKEHARAGLRVLIHVGSPEDRHGIDWSGEQSCQRLPGPRSSPIMAASGQPAFRQTHERPAAEGATEMLSMHISHKRSAVVDAGVNPLWGAPMGPGVIGFAGLSPEK